MVPGAWYTSTVVIVYNADVMLCCCCCCCFCCFCCALRACVPEKKSVARMQCPSSAEKEKQNVTGNHLFTLKWYSVCGHTIREGAINKYKSILSNKTVFGVLWQDLVFPATLGSLSLSLSLSFYSYIFHIPVEVMESAKWNVHGPHSSHRKRRLK